MAPDLSPGHPALLLCPDLCPGPPALLLCPDRSPGPPSLSLQINQLEIFVPDMTCLYSILYSGRANVSLDSTALEQKVVGKEPSSSYTTSITFSISLVRFLKAPLSTCGPTPAFLEAGEGEASLGEVLPLYDLFLLVLDMTAVLESACSLPL